MGWTIFQFLLFVKGHYCTIRLELASYWIIATSPPITFRPRIVEKQLEINKVRLVMPNRETGGWIVGGWPVDVLMILFHQLSLAHLSPSLFFYSLGNKFVNSLGNKKLGLRRTRKLRQCINWKENFWICILAKASNIRILECSSHFIHLLMIRVMLL